MIRFVAIAIVVASTRVAFAQVAPGAPDSPAEDPPPADPAPVEPPDTSSPPETQEPALPDAVVAPPIEVIDAPEPPPPVPDPPAPEPPPPQLDPTTSATWQPGYHFDLHWQLLMLPERVIELAFLPIGLAVGAVQDYRLDKRFGDLLTFYNDKVSISPRAKFSFGDGLGGGVWIKRQDLFDHRADFRVGGLVRVDRDWQIETEYKHALLFPGGRGLRLRAFIENDKNQRFYGIGSSTEDDRRALRSFDYGMVAEMDLQGIDRYTGSGIAQLGVRRQLLSEGTDEMYPPVAIGDAVIPPPGFGETATYIDARIVGRYDTRDTVGRPTRGVYMDLALLGRKEITGKDLSALTIASSVRVHLPVLTDHRVLVVTLSGAAAVALPGDELPLDSLAVIGRSNVRGYDRDRFRDRYAMQASAEYRFPIYEYLTSSVGLDAFAFLDAGTTWGDARFSIDPLRYSAGGGFRGAHETALILETTLGWSPEGIQLNVGVEKAL